MFEALYIYATLCFFSLIVSMVMVEPILGVKKMDDLEAWVAVIVWLVLAVTLTGLATWVYMTWFKRKATSL